MTDSTPQSLFYSLIILDTHTYPSAFFHATRAKTQTLVCGSPAPELPPEMLVPAVNGFIGKS